MNPEGILMKETHEELNQDSMQQFVENNYNNPQLKAKSIIELHTLGFRKFIKKHFTLTAYQEKGLDTIKDTDAEALFTNAIITTLNRNGTIKIVHTGNELPKIGMSINFDITPSANPSFSGHAGLVIFQINC